MAPAAAAATPAVKLTLVAKPVNGTAIAQRAGDAGIYLTEQAGTVRVVRGGKLAPTPVLDISADVSQNGGEQGLLGLAFAPDGAHLYLDYTDRSGTTQVVEYAMRGANGRHELAPSRAERRPATEQPQRRAARVRPRRDALHRAGRRRWCRRPRHRARRRRQRAVARHAARQDPPHRPDAARHVVVHRAARQPVRRASPAHGREIWSYGLRNPWRFTFDSQTGDLWIGDVGQNAWEEIDHAAAVDGRDAGRGVNFGWNRLEGTHPFSGTAAASSEPPVFEYSHDDGSCSVTGGYVYRGRAIAALRGMYVFTDYCTGAHPGPRAASQRLVHRREPRYHDRIRLDLR